MQRPPLTRDLKEGSSVSVSALALIIRLPILGSAAQCGIKPQCMSLHSLAPLRRTITGIVGEVSGATLKRGVYLGRSRSRFQRTRISLNSNVAVKRPHMSEKSSVVFVARQGQFVNQGDTTPARAWMLRAKGKFSKQEQPTRPPRTRQRSPGKEPRWNR